VFVWKSICKDYRKLNDLTKEDSFPLPRITNTLNMLTRAKWFSTLNLKSSYWQVAPHTDNKEKISFNTGQGLRQFTVMPFSLCNALETFKWLPCTPG
jgi:hypothetical protein